MSERETSSCPSCGHPSHADHAPGCPAIAERATSDSGAASPEKEHQPTRPLDVINAEAARAFPGDPGTAKAYREFLLKGVHSPETQAIDAVAHEKLKERGWEFVDIYGGTSMRVGPDEPSRFLLTNKLNGCVATLISADRPDGGRDVAMTHFPDLAKEKNFQTFDEIVGDMAESSKKKVVLMVTRRHSGVVEDYRKKLRDLLGADVEIEVELYRPDPEKEDTGVMIVEVPSAEKGKPRYQTWEKEGSM